MIAKSSQCQLTALATAVLLTLTSLPAGALSLGRISVQSALGEPLRAEVDFLDINADEAATLSTRVAPPDAFKAAGLEYNAALSNLRTSLQRRANGRAFLKLSSDSIVNEPFVDVILEASWSSGRIVRDYTLLFDPPNLRSATAQAPDSAQLPAASDAPVQAKRSVSVVAPKPVASTPVATPRPKAAAQPTTAPADQSVRVQPGQTAGQIAAAHLPVNVSLDQMLVAMLRSNPDAFIKDNVNRVKAGAVLALPTAQSAQATSAEEATQIVVAQSKDFNEFRRKLADNVGPAQAAPAAREATGQLRASVQDKKPTPAAPDKLTLSKGTVQGKSGEDQLAKTRNAEQASARAAELAKNISALKQLASAASAPSAPVAAQAPVALPSLPVPASSAAVPTPAITAPDALQPPASAVKPAPAPAVRPSLPAPVVEAEPGFIDTLLADPIMPAGVVALLALLAALGVYKHRQRKKDTLLDSTLAQGSAPEGSSGGQSVDTNDSLGSGSSMVYSPSQLDGTDDVDPLAEADVYLAYGRDLQAEEILKDALRSSPDRIAIHAKLAEIYAKRQDAKSLEAIATQAFNLTDGAGPQWEHICEKGLSIDPDNALYLPGGQPNAGSAAATVAFSVKDASSPPDSAMSFAEKAQQTVVLSRPGALEELDLDLDFSLEEPTDLPDGTSQTSDAPATVEPVETVQTVAPVAPEPVVEPDEPQHTVPGGLDFTTEPAPFDPISKLAALHEELPDVMPSAQTPDDFEVHSPAPTMAPDALPDLPPPPADLPQPSVELALSDTAAPAEPAPPKFAAKADPDMLSFDIDSLSLDLADDNSPPSLDAGEPAMDPLETKLALAEEFRAIGDDDGARALIEEVISEATGDIKAKAQAALAKL